MQQTGEPSVEEILDSIKKVIARDNREGAILERRRRTAATMRESLAEPASLEGLTREMLRPMLAQWLDDNLPRMVEDLVKAEIARIAGKRS